MLRAAVNAACDGKSVLVVMEDYGMCSYAARLVAQMTSERVYVRITFAQPSEIHPGRAFDARFVDHGVPATALADSLLPSSQCRANSSLMW